MVGHAEHSVAGWGSLWHLQFELKAVRRVSKNVAVAPSELWCVLPWLPIDTIPRALDYSANVRPELRTMLSFHRASSKPTGWARYIIPVDCNDVRVAATFLILQ